jgi:coenzyme F420-reducing hydrogenase alpha subunit
MPREDRDIANSVKEVVGKKVVAVKPAVGGWSKDPKDLIKNKKG